MRLDGVPDMASGRMEGPPPRKRRGFHRGKKNAGEIIEASFREAANKAAFRTRTFHSSRKRSQPCLGKPRK